MALDDQFSIVFEALKGRLRDDLKKDVAKFKESVGGQLRGKKDICKTNTTIKDMDYGAWFNYFWNEATNLANKSSISQAEMGRIAAVVFPIELRPNRPVLPAIPIEPRPEFLKLVDSGDDKSPEEILDIMFNAGFEQAEEPENPDSKFIPDFALAQNMVTVDKPGYYHGRFAFRGEGRSPFTVQTQNGAVCRADLTDWVDKANINAWWHPWSGREGGKKTYFRKGSRDNDFLTVTSLALQFPTATAYPMVHLGDDLKGPVRSWGVLQQLAALKKGFYIVKCRRRETNTEEDLLAMVSYVYVIDVAGQTVFRTWTLNDYDESGTRSVTMANMIAFVRVLRILLPPKEGECFNSTMMGWAFTVHPLGSQLWPGKEQVRARLKCTDDGIRNLEADLKQMTKDPFDVNHQGKKREFTYERPKGGPIGLAYSTLR